MLARLSLDEKDIDDVVAKLSSIVDFVDQLQAAPTDDVVPMAHPMDMVQRLRADNVTEIERHSGVAVSHVVVNSHIIPLAPEFHQEPLSMEETIDGFDGLLLQADVVDDSFPSRHDSGKLAALIIRISR